MKAKPDKSEILKNALSVFEIKDDFTMKSIKNKYRYLMKKWHPDKNSESYQISNDKTIEIKNAYEIIIDYINNYTFSFEKLNNLQDLSAEDFWFQRFGEDPNWSSNK